MYVPRDKDCFKLRASVEKRVVVTISQVSHLDLLQLLQLLIFQSLLLLLPQVSDNLTSLKVERCFGMLVSPGRNVRHSDMQLLEGVKMVSSQAGGWTVQVGGGAGRAGGKAAVSEADPRVPGTLERRPSQC